ncbi:putative ABC transport system substrate-binding protein [Dethiosulfatibacter aminovorans DSM 17477]|uniref:Putative ABC transport system substrate-binding protein n=1 Tax=Dethiosulfatibacter aminovorans DSM 17477 TaxID=1121476 RepID=A0A1M6F790_9FIRM|nr:ABC transporter substrate-binding protein [Dethiosulfatibacter aminovorans]SHI93526.1 putative ABC transport system substrate-binding protein [Dethiosulfatibacter aminovorans DSM 17477]
MKKLVSILLIIALMMGMAGCGAKETEEATSEKIQVGIIQIVDNGAFEDMRNGFMARLEELGYTEDMIEFDYKNAQGDMTNLNSICQEMVNRDVDLIAAIATPAAQAIVNMETDIPVIFISLSNPLAAGVITDMEKPDKNATGTSNAIPISEIFELSDRLTPGKTTYGMLYNTGEVNSVNTIKNAKEYLDSRGLSYVEKTVANSSEVQQAAQSLVDQVDAIFIPNDSVIQSAMPQVAEAAKEAGIPVYGSSAVMVASGAFATISIDDVQIGAISADMADKVLKGTPISEIPAIVVSDFTTVINTKTAEVIGVELSQDILDAAVLIEE